MIDRLNDSFKEPVGILNRFETKNFAVLVPLIFHKGEYYFLFQKRAKGIRQGGEISFCGGEREENDKDFRETAIRETIEEIGIDRDKIEVLGQLDTLVTPKIFIVESFIAILHIKSIDELNINRDEVESIFMLPVKFFENGVEIYKARSLIQPSYINQNGEEIVLLPSKELNLPEIYHSDWGHSISNIYLYRSEFGAIWGLTSLLIREVLRRIEK